MQKEAYLTTLILFVQKEGYLRECASARNVKWDDVPTGSQQLLLECLLSRPLTEEEIVRPKRDFVFPGIRAQLPRNPAWNDVITLLAYGASVKTVRGAATCHHAIQ